MSLEISELFGSYGMCVKNHKRIYSGAGHASRVRHRAFISARLACVPGSVFVVIFHIFRAFFIVSPTIDIH